MPQENPFEAPVLHEETEREQVDSNSKAERQYLIPLKWLFVCVVSAAPSFGWGLTIGRSSTEEILAMLAGIAVFVVIYSLSEFTEAVRTLKANTDLRRSLKIGYITRVAISILFPIGLGIDMFVGILSVQVVSVSANVLGVSESAARGFGFFFVTTLVQGLFLNCVLFLYVLIVYAIIKGGRGIHNLPAA